MKKWAAYTAGALTFMGALGHMIGGGKAIADPLLTNSTLSSYESAMIWMVWHVTSATFISMAIMYVVGAYKSKPDYIRCALLLTIMIGLVGLIAPYYVGVDLKILPNGLAFIPIGILGYISIQKPKQQNEK